VAHYPFNGNTEDESGNGNHLSNNGAILGNDRSGNEGKAYEFDGVNDYLSTNRSQLSLTNSLTVSLWVKNSDELFSDNYGNYIISKGATSPAPHQDFAVYLLPTERKIRFTITNESGNIFSTFTSPIEDHRFYHVAGVYDYSNSKLKVYLNGELQEEIDATGLVRHANDTFYIGDWNGSSGWHFSKGTIDDVRLYRRPLSNSEIVTLYREGAERIYATIDHTKIDENLSDFPVLVHLSDDSGINNFNASEVFDETKVEGNDSFQGVDGSPADERIWAESDSANLLAIQNNTLHFSSSASENLSASIQSKYKLSGDFDIELAFETQTMTNPSSSGSYAPLFRLYTDDDNWAFVGFQRYSTGSPKWCSRSRLNGSLDSHLTYASLSLPYSGKVRITRSGSTVKCFIWHNNRWEWNGDPNGRTMLYNRTDDVPLSIYFDQDFDSTVEADATKITINSGAIVWPNGHPHRKKIAVYDQSGNPCYTEIEKWDAESKKAWLWVKVPEVSAAEDTRINIYYDAAMSDNTDYVGDTGESPAQNVWDPNFKAVYHFGETSGSFLDSTSRRNNGTTVNLSSSERTQNSPIGNAFLFSGSEYINLPDNADFKPNYVTVEALARVNADNPDWARIFDRYHHPSTGYALAINNTGKYLFHPRLTGGVYSAATSSQVVENDGAWHNVAGSYQSGKTRLFNDGALNQETSTNNDIIAHESSETPRIGVGVYDPYYFRGTISEIRISDIARSAGWLKATDYSNTDGLLSFSVSPDTTAPGEVTNLVVETHSDGTSVHLDWSAYEESVAGDVDEYRIYVQTAPFDTISGLTPIFTVPAGTTYYIAVAVVDMVGNVDTAVSPTAVTPVDTTPPPATDIDSGLVTHLPFDGDALDQSGNANDGSVSGAVLSEDRFGVPQRAYSFNGVSDYISGTDTGGVLPSGSDPRTISVWIKGTDPGGVDAGIFHYGTPENAPTNFHLFLTGSGKPALGNGYGHGVIVADDSVTDNQWHHVVGVYEDSGSNPLRSNLLTIYVDGVEKKLGSPTAIPDTTANSTWRVGLFLAGGTSFDGVIDDLRVYDRALSSAEIAELYDLTDADQDLIPDVSDNCPEQSNPDQADTDELFDAFHIKDDSVWVYNHYQSIDDSNGAEHVLKNIGTRDNYSTNFYRTEYSLTDGDTATIEFKVSSGDTNAHFAVEASTGSGGWDTPDYHRFGIICSNQIVAQVHEQPTKYTRSILNPIKTNTWYVLKVDVNDAGRFKLKVHERENPGVYGEHTFDMPSGLNWRFHHWNYRNTA